LVPAEQSWALGAKAKLLNRSARVHSGRALLTNAIKLNPDTVEQGQYNYQLGYCA